MPGGSAVTALPRAMAFGLPIAKFSVNVASLVLTTNKFKAKALKKIAESFRDIGFEYGIRVAIYLFENSKVFAIFRCIVDRAK